MPVGVQAFCEYYLAGDLNFDCKVDLNDLAVLASNWLVDCNFDPENPACIKYEECIPGQLQCGIGQYCHAGNCVCAIGLTKCGGGCYDLERDDVHCGVCWNVCLSGQRCVQGVCVLSCSAGLTQCGNLCVNTLYDPDHCGTCFSKCAPDQYCDGGLCKPK